MKTIINLSKLAKGIAPCAQTVAAAMLMAMPLLFTACSETNETQEEYPDFLEQALYRNAAPCHRRLHVVEAAEELFDRRFAQRAQHQLYRCTRKTGRNGLGMPAQFRFGERALYGSAAAVDVIPLGAGLRYHVAFRHYTGNVGRGTPGRQRSG